MMALYLEREPVHPQLLFSINLKKKNLDILIGGIVPSVMRDGYIEASDWFLPNSLIWIVPSASEKSKKDTMWMLLRVNSIYPTQHLFCTLD